MLIGGLYLNVHTQVIELSSVPFHATTTWMISLMTSASDCIPSISRTAIYLLLCLIQIGFHSPQTFSMAKYEEIPSEEEDALAHRKSIYTALKTWLQAGIAFLIVFIALLVGYSTGRRSNVLTHGGLLC
jgi:hypothetical protein